MKKFLLILLSLTLALGIFTACGDKKAPSYKVEVVNGVIVSTGATSGEFKSGEEITVKFNSANGIEFLGWETEDGEFQSEEEEYTFTVTGNVKLIGLSKTVNKNFEDVVFPETLTVGYNGSNAVPALTFKDSGDAFTQIVYKVKNAAGEEIGAEAVELGQYEVTATLSADNYNTVTKTMNLTIVEGTLPTDVVDTKVTYDPTTVQGIKVINLLADTNLTIEYKDATGAVVAEPKNAGVYTAVVTAAKANYTTKTVNATLTIEKAQGIVEAPNSVTMEIPSAAVTSIAGVVLNNEEQTVTYTFSQNGVEVAAPSAVGSYDVVVTAAETANYKAAVAKRIRLVIAAQAIVDEGDAVNLADVKFENVTLPYNGKVQEVVLTGNFVAGSEALYSIAYKDNAFKNVGTYNATAYITNINTGSVVEKDAVLEITPIPLTIAAQEYSQVQGTAIPDIAGDVVYTGFAEGEDKSVLSGRLIVACDAVRTSDTNKLEAQTYPIVVSGYTSGNYTITFVDGKIDVTMPTYTTTAWENVSEKLKPADGDYENAVLGLQYNENVQSLTTLYGEEFYGMGVNFFSLMGDATPAKNYDATEMCEHLELLASYNVKAIRFSLMPFYVRQYGSFVDYYGSFIRYLDDIVNKAEEVGIGLIPSFFWTSAAQDYFDEGTAVALRDPDSKTSKFMMEYTAFLVNRYSSSPALFMWEYGNEYNLSSEIWGNPPALPNGSNREQRTKEEDMISSETMHIIYTRWVETIHENDPYKRCIANGDAVYRQSQYQQNLSNTGDNLGVSASATEKEKQFAIAEYINPGAMNAISWHVYAGVNSNAEGNSANVGTFSREIPIYTWKDYMEHMMEMGKSMQKTCYFGECGTGADSTIGLPGDEYDYADQKRVIDAIGDAMMETHFPLALLWNYDPAGYLPEDRTDEHSLGTEWSWCVEETNNKGFYFLTSVKETNDAIDSGVTAGEVVRQVDPVRPTAE